MIYIKRFIAILLTVLFVSTSWISAYAFDVSAKRELSASSLPKWCDKVTSDLCYRVDEFTTTHFQSVMGGLDDRVYIDNAINCLAKDNGIDISATNVHCIELSTHCSNDGNTGVSEYRHYVAYFIAENESLESSNIYFRIYRSSSNVHWNIISAYSYDTGEKINGLWIWGYCDDNAGKYYAYIDYSYSYVDFLVGKEYELTYCSSKSAVYHNVSNSDIVGGSAEPFNRYDLVPKQYGVLEVPKELSVSGGTSSSGFNIGNDDNMTLHWTQTDPTYKEWETEILVYADLGVKNVLLPWTDYYKVDDFYLYSDIVKTKYLKWDYDREKMVSNNPLWLAEIEEGLGYTGGTYESLFELTIMMRNKYYDGTYTYYSNWIEVVFDDEGMAGTVNNNAIPTEKEYDDPYSGDSDTDFTQQKPNGATNPDSEYQGQIIEGDKGSLSGLTEALSNGFGLLGEGGILDMIKDFFSFVPSWIWSLIGTTVAMACIIFLIKVVI